MKLTKIGGLTGLTKLDLSTNTRTGSSLKTKNDELRVSICKTVGCWQEATSVPGGSAAG